MTEVDAVLPEGITSVPVSNKATDETNTNTTITIATTTTTTTTRISEKLVNTEDALKKYRSDNDDVIHSNKNENSNSNSNSNSNRHIKDKHEDETNNMLVESYEQDVTRMEVDNVEHLDDTEEEDDSQITTSTENKIETPTVDGDDDDEEDDDDVDADAEADDSGEQRTNGSSCDVDNQLDGLESAKDLNAKNMNTDAFDGNADGNEDKGDEGESINTLTKTGDDSVEESQQRTSEIETAEHNNKINCQSFNKNIGENSQENTPNGPVITNKDIEISTQRLMDTNNGKATILEKENGIASEAEVKIAAQPEGGVVNLDDSDEEMAEIEEKQSQKTNTTLQQPNVQNLNVNHNVAAVNAVASTASTAIATRTSNVTKTCEADSDEAVVIGSDSEPEGEAVTRPIVNKKTTQPTAAVSTTSILDDDDDDDCVVIEDDTPPANDVLLKRKNDMNDLPPNKRQRSVTPANVGQLTIKDARTLMPQDAVNPIKKDGIYPITITSATSIPNINMQSGPPKLVPMSATPISANLNNIANVTTAAPNLAFTGLPSMTNNANLLPGLTDDMYVLEAPSFIVPYIYEKPPTSDIKEIVKQIETQYDLSAEDLAEADKSDEFDMMTEQNKADKAEQEKRSKNKDDDSWSEQSDDDDDDDDDSESGMRTKVLIKEANDDLTALKSAIKPASALAQSGGSSNGANNKPGQENYFESPLGKFFMDIGVGLVQEYVQADLLRLQKRKMRKSLSRDPKDFELAINALSGNLQASKAKNAPYKFTMKRCEFCNFKSESALSMANHYETPHMNGVMYKCNFCTFEIRNATEIVYHMEAMHNIKARLIKPLPYHQCANCGFEDNGKAKLARHQPVCAKKFRPELNLAPPNDWEAPAKIPRIKPRHGLVGTATAYQAMAAQAAAQKAALASIQAQQAQAAQARNLQAAALAAQNAAKMRARTPNLPKPVQNTNPTIMRGGPAPPRNPISTNVVLPNNYQLAAGLVQQASKKPIGGQPSISITPLPRQNATNSCGIPAAATTASAASSSKLPTNSMKPGQSPSTGNSKAQFVICEICDGYIKDLEQLRNHMQWMHKVKIHPKMIYNRPPLNCQKCQFRFFTDQGLERHLLGSHGLVTSSMQEAANKGKDAGRCPICGRMYQWKLLNHVSRDHHMTLKPAHLSYKCTVCTATFGMYKQFETHVYTAHSSVAKKAMDNKKTINTSAAVNNSNLSRNSFSAANDSLLKPLKINDEITIIPQPASKPRITNMESHVID